ncbi:MAG: hypothetical protein U0638_01805 [Phycisphaerales bacterium]
MIYLALIAVIEAVVYQRRYRSATHGGPLEAAWWALCTCVLRFAAPLLGVAEFFKGGDPVILTAVYAVPAAIATWAMRWCELRRGAKETGKKSVPNVRPTGSFTWILASDAGDDLVRIVAEEAMQIEPTNAERGA